MELISREAAKEAITNYAKFLWDNFHETCNLAGMVDAIDALPTIDPVKHGKWIKHRDRTCWYCSECTTDDYYAYTWDYDTNKYKFQDNYCPNCGARMEGEEDE